jgi:NADH:ubiquinone oxidoreductase subunit 2 (subunit N)
MNFSDFQVILPLVVLVIWAVILVLVDLWIPKKSKGITAALAVVGMVLRSYYA